ncbi:MAG: hypothetical protein HY906_09295 [Deltaproteobacteria bacterium]|nr:hypothetical protein [Deltaproteobacteria bacterium]
MPAQVQSTTEPAIDEKVAAQALDAEKASLAAYPVDELIPIRLDVIKTVATVLTVAKVAVGERALYEQTFRDFDLARIDTLERVGQAAWMTETQYRRLEAGQPAAETRPPAPLLERCRELKVEMLEGLGYALRADQPAQRILSDIRRGTGYLDLADDLQRLADLAHVRFAAIEHRCDLTRGHVDEARKLGSQLMETISTPQPKDLSQWADLRVRAWTRVCRNYEEVRAAAAYIHRHDPERFAAYPSLFAIRAKRTKQG